jgi:hypothetical protein
MNGKQKSWLAGGLGSLAALVWVPQLLSLAGHEPPALPELSAEEPLEQPVEASPPAAAEALPSPAPATEAAMPMARLSQLEESLNALAHQDSATGLDALLAHLDPSSTAPAPAEALDLDRLRARKRLEDFAALEPFTGLVLGPNDAAALFGHRVVRAGDSLAGGEIRVLSIRAQGVELGNAGASLLVELPAFCARGREPVSSAGGNTPPAAGAAGGVQSAPQSVPQPAAAATPATEEKGGA